MQVKGRAEGNNENDSAVLVPEVQLLWLLLVSDRKSLYKSTFKHTVDSFYSLKRTTKVSVAIT